MITIKKRERKVNIIEKIKLWWRFEGKHIPRNIKQGIKSTIYWLPVIWKDRNYDHTFIYEVLKHKLKAQANYIGGKKRHTRAQQDTRRMLICAKLLQKMQDDAYTTEYLNYVETTHWFEDVKERPGYSTWESATVWEKYDDYFKKYPLVYKKVMRGEGMFSLEGREDDKQSIAMNIAHLNHQRAHKLIFKIIEENIEGWWD